MSEKMYAWLLRLYPAHFREAYGNEALQLFRDRARDEKGFSPGLRLWLDLLADLAFSLPRAYWHVQAELVGASARQRSDGVPSFQVLKGELPHPAALLFGSGLAMVILGAFPIVLSDAANQATSQRSLGSRLSLPPAPPHKTDDANSTNQRATARVPELDAASRHRVIAKATEYLKQYYIYPDIAQRTADVLLAHEKSGEDDAATEGPVFAWLLTRQMNDVSHDRQLIMAYQPVTIPERPPGPTPEDLAEYRREMERSNCTFEKVEVLPHNIGYVKLNSFPDPSVCRAKAADVMVSLNNVDAMIFDLRDNRGGSADMVALLATYLFDRPTHLNDFYDRGANSNEQSWTLPPIPGNKLSGKPAYVLTSASSFSAAEAFSYDLKMLKRVTLVGETTSGQSHVGMAHRIDDHFIIRIPGIRAINPISKTNWEGTGVEPDVKVRTADALATAEKLARNKLQKK